MIYQEMRNYYGKKILIYTHEDDRLKYDYSNNILQPILLIYWFDYQTCLQCLLCATLPRNEKLFASGM